MSRKKLRSKEECKKRSSKKSINIMLEVIRNNKIWGWTWEQEMASCLYGRYTRTYTAD